MNFVIALLLFLSLFTYLGMVIAVIVIQFPQNYVDVQMLFFQATSTYSCLSIRIIPRRNHAYPCTQTYKPSTIYMYIHRRNHAYPCTQTYKRSTIYMYIHRRNHAYPCTQTYKRSTIYMYIHRRNHDLLIYM